MRPNLTKQVVIFSYHFICGASTPPSICWLPVGLSLVSFSLFL